ncbi:OsmC family protein [Marimonas arenosa]|uniref:OsmC family protein n=1 Tax=Marimonas arenosa TaxID=1795305 RepID=A0AAE3WC38_9RHOB|nr:OsmC family protein [Marimonas arenosa]MDQ2089967.1 OsmC family protein [Marimonas arenosa]
MSGVTLDTAPDRAVVEFRCTGTATGKMRNELDVRMTRPMEERFDLATDEGPFHGGDATAPPPLALFIASLTGCLMTQLRAFARRLEVPLDTLTVDTTIEWDWARSGAVYETAPKSFAVDVNIDSPAPAENVEALIRAAKKGCFIEQTLGQANRITHRMKRGEGWVVVR